MIDCGCDEILLPQGSNGVDGKNAFTVTTVQFTQPAANNSVTITVSDTVQNTNQWAIPGQIIRITDASSNGGWYRVTSITGTTQITIVNLDYQPGSSSSPTNILVGAKVSPAGLQGPAGGNGDQGGQGVAGPANELSIGAVSTLTPGSLATATISGTVPNQTLNLGIPSGQNGQDGRDGGTLHYSYISTTALLPSTTPGEVVFSETFTANGLCPNNGDAAKISGSFFATGLSVIDASRRIANLNFYIGDPTSSLVDIVPKASVTPSNDQSFRPRDLGLNDPGDYGHFGFEIRINRVSVTQSIITVSWEWSGLKTTFFKKMFLSNSLTTGSLNFNTSSNIGFQIKIDAVYTFAGISINNRNLIVEKITT
jgi:hypothetical protein